MDEFNHLLSKKNAERQMPRKQSSLDQISNNIRRLYIKCYDAEPDDVTQIEGMVNDVDHVFACLQSDWQGKVKKLGYSAMLSYTNALVISNDLFELEHAGTYGELEVTLQVRREDSKRKNPVKETRISRSQLDEIVQGATGDVLDKVAMRTRALTLILSTYPFRLESATLERISPEKYLSLSDEEKGIRNFIVGSPEGQTWKFVFHGYKTNRKYGVREIPIERNLIETLLTMYHSGDGRIKGVKEGDYIFFPDSATKNNNLTREKTQEKQRNSLSVWTKRMLKKNGIDASATDITKLLISEIWDSGTTQEKIQFAQWRGHDPGTAAKVYASAK